MISKIEENFAGVVAAKIGIGDCRAFAKGESAFCGESDEVAHEGM